ncbi:DEAD/DEAH box helicase [Marinicrinis sediminis]|uniref:SNF2 helicase associated domain-containing protein n=1 Tax=Marinicrinis sediminis TaxID=1652465 RepID=A0ABW5REJ4_9BACL
MVHEQLNLTHIKQRCGNLVYRRGKQVYEYGYINSFGYDPEQRLCTAEVEGAESYQVKVDLSHAQELRTSCTCPAYYQYDTDCKHIAAVLLKLRDMWNGTSEPLSEHKMRMLQEANKTHNIISLLEQFHAARSQEVDAPELDERETVQVEYRFRIDYSFEGKHVLVLEMRAGVRRLYVVQRIQEFLEHVWQEQPYSFTKKYAYDPIEQTFSQVDADLMNLLREIGKNQTAFQDRDSAYARSQGRNETRELVIPPFIWRRMLPMLERSQTVVEHEGVDMGPLRVTEERIPFAFRLESTPFDSYELDMQELSACTFMESYGCVYYKGIFYLMEDHPLQVLQNMKSQFGYKGRHTLVISPSQMEEFMFRGYPGLKRVANIEIDQKISERFIQPPLLAKFYLDWQEPYLTARLEYHYDQIVINPFDESATDHQPLHTILLRDWEREQRNMSFVEKAAFKFNGKSLFLEEEADIYLFLFHIVPELEQEVELFGTPEIESWVRQDDREEPQMRVEMDTANRLLEVSFEMDGIDEADIRRMLDSVVEKRKYYRMPGGRFVSLEAEAFQGMQQLMEELGLGSSVQRNDGRIQLPMMRGFQIDEQLSAKHRAIRFGPVFQQLQEHLKHPERLQFTLPPAFEPVLRDYQKKGFHWLKTLAYYQFGGILADDMGLGKTLQSIAYLVSEQTQDAPALIISPSSLIYNWESECHKFAPELRVLVVAGDKETREELRQALQEVDVIVTSYPLIRRDIEMYQDVTFSSLFLDEAQALKNATTQTAKAVKQLAARHRFALTGTPIENKLEELWSIFDIVFPDLYPDKKSFLQLSPEMIARRTRPFILRRLKKDVLTELPDKIETVQYTELHAEQKALYMGYLQQIQQETLTQLQEEGFQKSRMKILAGLTRLRQLCCHPALFLEQYTGTSGKLEQLMEMVSEYTSEGRRLLVFSQFTSMLALIRQQLEQQGIDYFYLDGSTPSEERLHMSHRFNQGERDMFLISLKAGGTGLNLTGADTVILYDLWWNPAVEQQAADRAHRMGQKKVVQVIRMVAKGTIEEKMVQLQEQKKHLIEQVIQAGETALTSFSEQEIREILSL